MKVTLLCKKSGQIESVALLEAAPTGTFHIEVESGSKHDLEMSAREINRDALSGRKGPAAQKKVYEKLERLRRGR